MKLKYCLLSSSLTIGASIQVMENAYFGGGLAAPHDMHLTIKMVY